MSRSYFLEVNESLNHKRSGLALVKQLPHPVLHRHPNHPLGNRNASFHTVLKRHFSFKLHCICEAQRPYFSRWLRSGSGPCINLLKGPGSHRRSEGHEWAHRLSRGVALLSWTEGSCTCSRVGGGEDLGLGAHTEKCSWLNKSLKVAVSVSNNSGHSKNKLNWESLNYAAHKAQSVSFWVLFLVFQLLFLSKPATTIEKG